MRLGAALGRGLALLLLALPAACGEDYGRDIAAVQQARTMPDLTNEALAKEIAGARGSIAWSAGPAEAYAGDADIVAVSARIERPTATGERRVVVLEFIHNRQTEKVALERLLVDGRPQGLLSGALSLLLMQLE